MKLSIWLRTLGWTGLILLTTVLAPSTPDRILLPSQAATGIAAIGTIQDSPPGPALIPPVSLERIAPQPAYSGCGGELAPVVNAAYEQEVVDRVNAIRAQHQLPPLKRVPPLDEAARYHGNDLGQDNYFDHDTYDRSGGKLVEVCEWFSRIQSYYTNWWSLAENIAAGYSTPESVMNGWMNSPGHRDNILRESVWEIGVGYYQGGGDYYRYWVQDFGRRSDIYPLIINRDAAATDSRDVSLYLYGDWQEMRLRNDDQPWTAWQPFQATIDWTLHWGAGQHTVYAEMRAGGQTMASQDTIYLTVSPPALGDLPDNLRFSYSVADGRFSPPAHEVTPQNSGNDDPLAWTATQEAEWYTVTPLSGTTPAFMRITPDVSDPGAPGTTHEGNVTVTVTDPAGVEDSPQQIDLSLQVVPGPYHQGYLPVVVHHSAATD